MDDLTKSTKAIDPAGVMMIVFSAIGFSFKAILAKLLYQDGFSPITVLFLRMALAAPLYLLLLVQLEKMPLKSIPNKIKGQLILLGLLGYYLSSWLDFKGLEYISASLERLILFLYPTFTIIITAMVFGSQLKLRDFIALGICYSGLGFIFIPQLGVQQGPELWLGALLVTGSTITYAFYLSYSSSMIQTLGTKTFTALVLLISTVAVGIHFALSPSYWHELAKLNTSHWLLMVAMAIGSTFLPTLFLAEGIKRLGSERASILSTMGPLSTLFLAYALLDEVLLEWQWFGASLIIFGVWWISSKRKV
jgi:drug/metabolite transporter (DMT)-like permease